MVETFKNIETRLIHSGEPKPRIMGAIASPIFQSATYETDDDAESYHSVRYIRLSNTPNHITLSQKLAAIESAEDAVVTASGMAAISTSLLALLKQGDHMLAHRCLYGGTHSLVTRDLPDFGIECDFIDAADPDSWQSSLRPSTKLVYVETITNPLLEVCDLEAVVAFARQHGLIAVIDNTFATPVYFRPAELDFDLSLHSATKYLNGHADITAGACIGKKDIVDKIKHRLDHLGGIIDPHAAFLLNRGLKTLALRVRHQTQSAQRIAEFLAQHELVKNVYYPGLPSHPHYQRAKKLLGGCGGVLSFELKGGLKNSCQFVSEVKLPASAPSLGGVESLITRPCTTSHKGLTTKERFELGVTDALIRFSVGIESPDELIEDFQCALQAIS